MAQTLEFLTRQQATLTSIRSIVHTMKTLSAINASPYEQAAQAIAEYRHTLVQGFAAFAYRTGPLQTGPLQSSTTQISQQLLVVFGSDHGLCGGYNELLAEQVHQYAIEIEQGLKHELDLKHKPQPLTLLCVGAQMSDALQARGLIPEAVLLPPASADGIGRLATELVTRIEAFSQAKGLHSSTVNSTAVGLAFTQRAEHHLRDPHIQALLPLDPSLLARPKRWDSRSLPDYNLPPDTLLSALLRNYLFASIFGAAAEAMVTENAARLALMQQAEQSVDERLEEVKGELNYVRQTDITNELMDVIIGHLE
ncbi:FoF1 ATP synthase subunit gamma [Oceanisphaera sp. IT1-181]|uniref:F0F1 ATP synthase subunit gamma n=1 Tax=Oceanisphaera sp. IT1-181 TaxID=3081199 RepID=UPI0029C9B62E|nr:FoF1 ATP synthase subunit gamma [Oceanisphaera sp. IT1-181]